jgi:protein Mpv17
MALALYSRILKTNPLVTKSVTSGFMYGGGDLIAQGIEYHVKTPQEKEQSPFRIDWKRCAIFSIYGTVIAGPMYHYWFSWLDRIPYMMMRAKQQRKNRQFEHFLHTAKKYGLDTTGLKPRQAKEHRKWVYLGTKVAADQFIFGPVYLLIFFYTTGLMSGKTISECNSKVKQSFLPTYLLDSIIWPPIQALNFKFVKLHYQPLVVNGVNLFWNSYLSMTANGH